MPRILRSLVQSRQQHLFGCLAKVDHTTNASQNRAVPEAFITRTCGRCSLFLGLRAKTTEAADKCQDSPIPRLGCMLRMLAGPHDRCKTCWRTVFSGPRSCSQSQSRGRNRASYIGLGLARRAGPVVSALRGFRSLCASFVELDMAKCRTIHKYLHHDVFVGAWQTLPRDLRLQLFSRLR